ncbi:MAG: hypothetical protein DMF96_19350 [Acidobacteria bacterium]|nr:MAG: hypothetical protein DMF96_19350 [Acidobacteriota bacterium]
MGGRAIHGHREAANARAQREEVVVEVLGADRHARAAGARKDPDEDARPHRRRVQHGECGEQQRDASDTNPAEPAPPDERDHPLHHCRLLISMADFKLRQSICENLQQGRRRIVMEVRADGSSSLTFLDANGKVLNQLLPSGAPR